MFSLLCIINKLCFIYPFAIGGYLCLAIIDNVVIKLLNTDLRTCKRVSLENTNPEGKWLELWSIVCILYFTGCLTYYSQKWPYHIILPAAVNKATMFLKYLPTFYIMRLFKFLPIWWVKYGVSFLFLCFYWDNGISTCSWKK